MNDSYHPSAPAWQLDQRRGANAAAGRAGEKAREEMNSQKRSQRQESFRLAAFFVELDTLHGNLALLESLAAYLGIEKGEPEMMDTLKRARQNVEDFLNRRKLQIARFEQELGARDILIDEVDSLSVRTYNVLKNGGIHTLGELADYGEAAAKKLKNCGAQAMREIKTVLANHGMVLRQ